ncbi:glycosyltransferase family 2 protein [Paracoccus aerodenitrificans]|uniref:glycosyltransferase family 2 protein n=1 Tax=Paracoccus aerodenitrificans TaxID=3017781 RepID=UPI0022F06AA5|nr:glycosyltransferase family 2 protein [Paracoccus aerodenitrificans]WBU64481.1 glycosyltransferase family 2 protein [Paracoccus aerodenitrificans]
MVSPDRQYRLAAGGMAGMIADRFRQWKHRRRIARARAEIATRDSHAAPHGLDAPLVVSLTSYRPRFPALEMVLASLLRQSVAPDRIMLWLAEADMAELPQQIAELDLEIRVCPDWRSYKKIIPTLQDMPDSYIVTADDDIYYAQDWLEQLVRRADAGVVCHRGHRISLGEDGLPRSYDDWRRNITSPDSGPLVFPTGVGGVLYAPGVFNPDVTDAGKFQGLAPSADDVWLYWMHRLAGSRPAKIGQNFRVIEWPGSQAENLRSTNLGTGGNDRAIQAMLGEYGWPEP